MSNLSDPRHFCPMAWVYPPAPPPHVSPLITQAVLPNGLRVFLLEDHEVPLVRGTLVMRGGRYASPQDKVCVSGGGEGGSCSGPRPTGKGC